MRTPATTPRPPIRTPRTNRQGQRPATPGGGQAHDLAASSKEDGMSNADLKALETRCLRRVQEQAAQIERQTLEERCGAIYAIAPARAAHRSVYRATPSTPPEDRARGHHRRPCSPLATFHSSSVKMLEPHPLFWIPGLISPPDKVQTGGFGCHYKIAGTRSVLLGTRAARAATALRSADRPDEYVRGCDGLSSASRRFSPTGAQY